MRVQELPFTNAIHDRVPQEVKRHGIIQGFLGGGPGIWRRLERGEVGLGLRLVLGECWVLELGVGVVLELMLSVRGGTRVESGSAWG